MTDSVLRTCGIDVSLDHLDVDCLHVVSGEPVRLRLPNSTVGRQKLLKLCRRHKINLAVMEATGGMERDAHVTLHEGGIPVTITNPLRSRRFAQSQGQLAKNDPIDGRVLREMGTALKLTPKAPASAPEHARQRLSVRRGQLLEMKQMEANRRKQEKLPAMRKSIDAVIACLEKQILQVDEKLSELVKQDEVVEEMAQIIDAIPGFARVSSVALVCAMPELGKVNRQEIGSLGGLACYDCESGKYKGQRRIQGGRSQVRRALFMPTLTAIKLFEPTRRMYQRLIAGPGHVKMQAVTACMHKLLLIINSRVKEMLARRALESRAAVVAAAAQKEEGGWDGVARGREGGRKLEAMVFSPSLPPALNACEAVVHLCIFRLTAKTVATSEETARSTLTPGDPVDRRNLEGGLPTLSSCAQHVARRNI